MAKRRGLGRGLDALLGEPAGAGPREATDGELRNLPVDLVQRGRYQPRSHMDPAALEELADSIRVQGVVQPIVVRPLEGGARYEIIAGERRWRAAQAAGLGEVPAVVRDVPDEAAIAIALIENIQRENLNPMEEARALRRLLEEFDMTHQRAAEAVGRSRTAVTNLLRLLDLNDDVKELLETSRIDMGHARALLGLQGDAQSEAARQVVARGLSARETERLVRQHKAPAEPRTREVARPDPDVTRLEQNLSERLAARVQIQHGARGKGRLVIHYTSLDELDGILERIAQERDAEA